MCSGIVWGGITQAESPEWTPASSICSIIPAINTSSPSHNTSTSNSIASSKNLSTKIGCSGETLTYDGRTKTGNVILSAISFASSKELAVPYGAWWICNLFKSCANNSLSSTPSILSYGVPNILTPALANGTAKLIEVWPPNWTITPSGFSWSIIPITSSKVIGSKKSLSEIS